jgi:hypothetical protein
MTYRGHVANGVIVLDPPAQLPEGAEVEVSLAEPPLAEEKPAASRKSIEEEIAEIVADIPPEAWKRLPDDLSDQLDHYIYGTPKR